MKSLFGMSVIVRPDPRRYSKLPSDVCVTPAFRAEFDAWATEFFQPDPTLNLLKDGDYIIIGDRQVHMNPRTFGLLKRHTCSSKDNP